MHHTSNNIVTIRILESLECSFDKPYGDYTSCLRNDELAVRAKRSRLCTTEIEDTKGRLGFIKYVAVAPVGAYRGVTGQRNIAI